MPQRILKVIAIALTVLGLAMNQACEEPDEIGKDLLPPQDNLNVDIDDSTTIHAFSVIDDSLKTSDPQIIMAGSYFDPIFGQTDASYYAQLRMPSTDLEFGTNAVADSIVLSIPYFSFYGDTTMPLTFEVYELSDDLDPDTNYYSNDVTNYFAQALGSKQFYPKPQSMTVVGNDTLPPMIRIKIDISLAERFITQGGTSVFDDNESFLDYFKGIHVKAATNPGDGSILYFDPYSAYSNLTLYYQNDDDDSLKVSFYTNQLAAKYSKFDHDYSSGTHMLATALQQQLIQKDTTAPVESVFLQSMAGVNVRIRFPYLDQWKDKNIALNKATLVVETDTTDYTSDKYKEPLRLGLVKVNEEGKLELLTDYVVSSEIFDGYFKSNKNEYRFVITRHMQELLNGDMKDYGLYLVSDQRSRNAYRVALMGPQAQQRKMRLEMIYTELDQK